LSRFKTYKEKERNVTELILANMHNSLFPDGTPVSIVEPTENLSYDRIFIYHDYEIKVEIQITESHDFKIYGDVRLDLVSAFSFTPSSMGFVEGSTVIGTKARQFVKSLNIQKLGKLYSSKADLLCFYVTRPLHILWAYRMAELMSYRTYFMCIYGIKINQKSEDENWQSCFVPVCFYDKYIMRSGMALI